MVLARSPLAGVVLCDGDRELGVWRDEREVMPETLILVFKSKTSSGRVTAKIVGPETADPHWRVFIYVDAEPRISGRLQLRCGNREAAMDLANHHVRALYHRPGNST